MNRDEQKKFVKNLCQGMTDTIVTEIDNGKIPEDWDGFELRELIATIAKRNSAFIHKKRCRGLLMKFNNTVIVNDL